MKKLYDQIADPAEKKKALRAMLPDGYRWLIQNLIDQTRKDSGNTDLVKSRKIAQHEIRQMKELIEKDGRITKADFKKALKMYNNAHHREAKEDVAGQLDKLAYNQTIMILRLLNPELKNTRSNPKVNNLNIQVYKAVQEHFNKLQGDNRLSQINVLQGVVARLEHELSKLPENDRILILRNYNQEQVPGQTLTNYLKALHKQYNMPSKIFPEFMPKEKAEITPNIIIESSSVNQSVKNVSEKLVDLQNWCATTGNNFKFKQDGETTAIIDTPSGIPMKVDVQEESFTITPEGEIPDPNVDQAAKQTSSKALRSMVMIAKSAIQPEDSVDIKGGTLEQRFELFKNCVNSGVPVNSWGFNEATDLSKLKGIDAKTIHSLESKNTTHIEAAVDKGNALQARL